MEGHGGGLKQSKLLAAFAVLAMVVCAFAFVAPATDADADTATDATSITTGDEFVAAIDGTGGNYVLTKDITVTFTAKYTVEKTKYSCILDSKVVIDLNGHTVTATGGYAIQIKSEKADTAKLTLSNGTINWTGFANGTISAFSIEKNGSLCLNAVKFTTNGAAVFPNGDASKVEIIDCTIVAGTYAIGTNNGLSKDNKLSINVSGSTLSGTGYVNNDKDNCTVIINIPNAKLTITDSTIYGERQSLFIRCGTATVTNTVINYTNAYTGPTASSYDDATWGTGDEAPMSAVLVGDNTEKYNGTASLTMTGCTINASSGKAILTSKDNSTQLSLNLNSTAVSIDGNAAVLDGITATEKGFKISQGSIIIDGTYTVATAGGTITLTSGEGIVRSIPANADIVVAQGAKLTVKTGESLAVNGSITVQDGATLAVDGIVSGSGAITISEKGKMNVSGDISAASDITNNGTIYQTNKDAKFPESIGGTGTVDTSAVASEGTISGDWKTTTVYTENQTITLSGDTVLVSGTEIVIKGKLVIPEGMTLTIEDGAQLVIFGSVGKLENNGTIIVESIMGAPSQVTTGSPNAYGGALLVYKSTAVNNGAIILDYTKPSAGSSVSGFSMDAYGYFTNNGTISVGEDSIFYTKETFINSAGATIEMNGAGYLASDYSTDAKTVLKNAGTIVINGTLSAKSKITLTAADAQVQILTQKGKALIVDDSGVVKVKKAGDLFNTNDNSVTVTPSTNFSIEGVLIKSVVTKNDFTSAEETHAYIKNLDISGNIVSNDTRDTPATPGTGDVVTVALKGFNTITDSLNVGKNVKVTSEDVVVEVHTTEAASVVTNLGLIVTGEVSVVDGASFGLYATDDTMIVTGKVTVENGTIGNYTASAFCAAQYKIDKTTTTPDYNVYTSFATAVADGAKKINLYGFTFATENITVPAGTTVDNKGILYIGEDAKVDFAEGSVLKNLGTAGATFDKGIMVEGVLYIADVKGTKTPGAIVSDVVIEGEKDKTYCGIAYALANADEGDTVKLSNDTHVENSLAIPAGVTLDTNGKLLCLHKGVVLTIDGILYINDSNVAADNESGSALLDNAKIVLNGTVKSKDAEIEDKVAAALTIDGAYYAISEGSITNYYAEPVATAAPKIATVDDGIMTLKGDLKVGDVVFAGTSDVAVEVNVLGSITASSITINLGKIVFAAGETFDGVVTNGAGSIDINATSGEAANPASALVITSKLVSDVDTLIITGCCYKLAGDDAEKSVFTVTGNVTIENGYVEEMTVDGTLTVNHLYATVSIITINGTVNVANEMMLTVYDYAEVFGTLAVADKTAEKGDGSASITTLFVGLDKEDTVGAAGAITGDVTFTTYAAVGAGSTVPEDFAKKESTEFYIGDKLYMTVYGNATINQFKANVENADFQSWVDEDDKEYTAANPGSIGDADKVTAKVEYDVYGIKVLANAGVNDVSIDGNLMQYSALYGYYYAVVTAGSHTITYTLANGYTGTAKLAVNGPVFDGTDCTLDGMSFDVSGDFNKSTSSYEDTYQPVVTLQLTGIEKSGYVPDSPDTDNGMTITDYLLIVLVVLIVVMAIIVAMRMMRS